MNSRTPAVQLLLIAIGLLPSLAVAAPAQIVFHVAPTGDDTADGSAEHPVKSIHTAQHLLRERMEAGGPRWARVEIAAGTYALEKPLNFTPADSGESTEHPVTYAASGGDVLISGGTPITGWRQQDKQWVAKIPQGLPPFRDLWVNGKRAIRARSPNDGYFRIEATGPDDRTSFVVEPADLLTLARPETAEIGFLHDWSMSRVRLAAIDTATRTYKFADPIGAEQRQFSISNFDAHPRYFVENAPELLDAPGEWILDETAGEVRYMPRDGEKLETVEAVAPRLEQLVEIQNGERPVEHLVFDGITFCYSRFDLPPHGYAGIQSSWYAGRREANDNSSVYMVAAVTTDATRDCRFTNCRFEHLAACGLRVRNCDQTRIQNSIFRDLGGDGLLIGGDDMAAAHGNSVENCLIENCGATFFGAVGLWIGYASDTIVRHNEIRAVPYSGLSVGWNWSDDPVVSRGHQIRENHIHHVMQILSDGGGIYTLGRQPGTALADNVIHDVPRNAGRAESNGIFMDEGSTDMTVEDNTIYNISNSPIRFHRAGNNLVTKNRLVSAPEIPTFAFNAIQPSVITFKDNEEIAAKDWQPPANDAAINNAGPRSNR